VAVTSRKNHPDFTYLFKIKKWDLFSSEGEIVISLKIISSRKNAKTQCSNNKNTGAVGNENAA
jgi:hypothetical protein